MIGKVAVSRAACATAPSALRPIPCAYLGTVDAATTGRHLQLHKAGHKARSRAPVFVSSRVLYPDVPDPKTNDDCSSEPNHSLLLDSLERMLDIPTTSLGLSLVGTN